MKEYEKPTAEMISFETDSIMSGPGIGELPTISEGVEDW